MLMSMSLSLRISPQILHHSHLGFNEYPVIDSIPNAWTRFFSRKSQKWSLSRSKYRSLFSNEANGSAGGASDAKDWSPGEQGSMGKAESSGKESFSTKEYSLLAFQVLKKLRRYGTSGILSYGLLNTAYYLTTFFLVWFYVAAVPRRMGYVAAAERFLKVMAMVWAGSQVTKVLRAAGALALAPFVDSGLSWFTHKLNFESQGKAFMVIVGFCFGLAVTLFLVVTLLWA